MSDLTFALIIYIFTIGYLIFKCIIYKIREKKYEMLFKSISDMMIPEEAIMKTGDDNMNIRFIGSFSSYQLCYISTWIKEHLTDLTIDDKPYYVCDCKISKVAKYEILVEGEKK